MPNWVTSLKAKFSPTKQPSASPPSSKPSKEKPFDPIAFCDYVHEYGQVYRYRANVLISLCQTFSVTSGQSFRENTRLSGVLEACDKAMKRAANSKKKEQHYESEALFKQAIRDLNEYAKEFHPEKKPAVQIKIEQATKEDENNKYKRWDHSQDERMIEVEFHICSTLPCQNPIKVRQMLRNTSVSEVLPDIIWNFSHYEDTKSITLAQKPHLYIDLPTSLDAYRPTFSQMPSQTLTKDTRYHCDQSNYRDNPDRRDTLKVHLITNNSRRVFFVPELGEKGEPKAFDKVWVDNTLLFKGVHGELMGENSELFERSIRKSVATLRYQVQPSGSQTGSEGNAKSWTELIEKLQNFRDADIIISPTDSAIVQVQ